MYKIFMITKYIKLCISANTLITAIAFCVKIFCVRKVSFICETFKVQGYDLYVHASAVLVGTSNVHWPLYVNINCVLHI